MTVSSTSHFWAPTSNAGTRCLGVIERWHSVEPMTASGREDGSIAAAWSAGCSSRRNNRRRDSGTDHHRHPRWGFEERSKRHSASSTVECGCTEDRRVVYIQITEKALALLNRIHEPLDELHNRLIGHLTRAELKELSRLLEKARNSLEDPGDRAPDPTSHH